MCLSTSMTKLFYFIPFELSFSSSLPRINIKVLVDHDKQSLNSVSDKHSLNYSWRLKLSNFSVWVICWVMKIYKCSLLPPDLQNTINTTLSRHLDNGCFGFFFFSFFAFQMKSISLKTQRCLWLFIYIRLTVCSMPLKPFRHHICEHNVLLDDGNSWMKCYRKHLSSAHLSHLRRVRNINYWQFILADWIIATSK